MKTKNDRQWFKCYAKFWLDDPAIRRLPADYSLIYHQLYCLCAIDGDGPTIMGDVEDIAWRLHRATEYMDKALRMLVDLRLIEMTPTTVTLRLWNAEQPEITAADRMKAYRQRKAEMNQGLS